MKNKEWLKITATLRYKWRPVMCIYVCVYACVHLYVFKQKDLDTVIPVNTHLSASILGWNLSQESLNISPQFRLFLEAKCLEPDCPIDFSRTQHPRRTNYSSKPLALHRSPESREPAFAPYSTKDQAVGEDALGLFLCLSSKPQWEPGQRDPFTAWWTQWNDPEVTFRKQTLQK